MSTINSKTARELLEAYHAVYQTEETITEEQLWEEVENWVNTLIEEGYDLSEYTWEDMYDAYIEEQGGRMSGPERRAQQSSLRQQGGALGQRRAEVQARGLRGQGNRPLRKPGDPGRTSQPTTRIQRDAVTPTPTPTKPAAPKTAPRPSAPAPSRTPAPTAAAKTAPRPSAPAPAKQTGDKAKDMATWAKANPTLAAKKKTPNPLMQKTFGYQTGQQPTKPSGNIKPNVTGMKSGRLATAISGPNKKIGEGYDAYDIVLNYIAENGHAESLEEAHYIMMEMSPEMIQDIVETCINEGRRTSLSALSRESQKRKEDKERGRPETEAETHGRLMLGKFRPGASKEERAEGGRERLRDRGKVPKKGGKSMFEQVLEHLISEGYAETEEAAIEIIANMSEEWKQSIVEAPGEWFGGLRDRARASRTAQIQSMQPTPKPGPNVSSPFAKPASRNDSGKLTTYGAGGGAAAERRGQTRAQVMQQGAKNLETRNKSNPGPNFGR